MSTAEHQDTEVMDVDDERQLVPFNDPSKAPATIHNFTGTDQEKWEKVSFSRSVSCRKGSELINATFPLSYWLCHEAWVNKENGHKQKVVRTVLMDATGTCYGFTSNGVYDSLRDLVQALGPGPYEPPINITVRSKDVGQRRVYTIEPAPRRTEEPQP